MRGKERRWKIVALLAVGIAIGVAMTATPAVGHVSGWVHNWNRHIKPRTDARYYTKAAAEARYYNVGETAANAANAANADNLDGLDSTGYAKAAQGVRGYFVINGAQIQNAFSASGGTYVLAINNPGSDTIDLPFSTVSGVVQVTMGAGRAVGGTTAGCFPQVERVDDDTILVEVTRHDGVACDEEVTVVIF